MNSFVTEKLLSNKMAVDGKSRKRLSVIVLYHVSVFACGHIHYAGKTYKEDTQEAYL